MVSLHTWLVGRNKAEPSVSNVEIEMWKGKEQGNGGAWSWRIEFGGGGDGPSGTRTYRVLGGAVDIFQIFSGSNSLIH